MIRIVDEGTLDYFLIETYISDPEAFETDIFGVIEKYDLDETNIDIDFVDSEIVFYLNDEEISNEFENIIETYENDLKIMLKEEV